MIYIVKHKEYGNPVPSGYKELYVGRLFDGKEENIEHLNPYINEATGMYQIWKNHKEEIVGLVHYRRFFTEGKKILEFTRAQEILSSYDMITTPEYTTQGGVYRHFKAEITADDRWAVEKYYRILCDKDSRLANWFENSSFNPRNMFIARKELINDYFEWLFPLIIPATEFFAYEDATKVDSKRIMGYLTERMFGCWIRDKKVNCFRMEYMDV